MIGTDWRKSSYSSSNGGECVEAASGDMVLVRDTTNRSGGTLAFAAQAWTKFVTSLR
jgi:uncharacterized protein DUF397